MPKKHRKSKTKHRTFVKKKHTVSRTKLTKARSKVHKKVPLSVRLYDDQARGLFEVVGVLPLFIGAWLAGGLVLDEIVPFIIVTLVIGLAHFYETTRDREDIPFHDSLHVLTLAAGLASLLGLFSFTQQPYLTIYAGLAALMLVLEKQVPPDGPPRIMLLCFSTVLRCTILGIVGVLTQIFAKEPKLILEHGIIGFIPGMVLAASLVSRHSKTLLNAGWQRSQEHIKKDGEKVQRPGRLTQVFSLFLLIGPAIPVMFAPFNVFPMPFLLCALAFVLIPQIAQAFFHGTMRDSELTVSVVNLAAAVSVAVLAAAVLARHGY